jgi:hypothetical protein
VALERLDALQLVQRGRQDAGPSVRLGGLSVDSQLDGSPVSHTFAARNRLANIERSSVALGRKDFE